MVRQCEFVIDRKGEVRKGKVKTYWAAMTIVFRPDMLGVNSAPMAAMSFLMYSRSLPV